MYVLNTSVCPVVDNATRKASPVPPPYKGCAAFTVGKSVDGVVPHTYARPVESNAMLAPSSGNVSDPLVPPRNVLYNSEVPVALSFKMNASKPPRMNGWAAFAIGKLLEAVWPVTYACPELFTAILRPRSICDPPTNR